MATFTGFSNLLPDPVNKITDAGDIAASGTPGPGFSGINFQSVTDTQVSRTISGRGVTRDGGSHRWEFTIQYHPMLRTQFEPVFNFLQARNPRRDPFYVILPQHTKPRDLTYYPIASTYVSGNYQPGVSQMMLYSSAGNFVGNLKPGDMFNILDGNDFNHQKTYRVTGAETNAYYQAGTTQPSLAQQRIRFSPPLQRYTSSNSRLVFQDPKFRVIAKNDVLEYSLDTDNLYSFSLPVEEIQP